RVHDGDDANKGERGAREALRTGVASHPCARELRTAGSQRAPPHNHDYTLGHGHVEDRDTHASAQANEPKCPTSGSAIPA
ncbi:hypothetical protein X777_01129, partial [Ooceraea biroi]